MKKARMYKCIFAWILSVFLIFSNGYGGILSIHANNVESVEAEGVDESTDFVFTMNNGTLFKDTCRFVLDQDAQEYKLQIPSSVIPLDELDAGYNLPNKELKFNGNNYSLYIDAGTCVRYDIETNGKEVYFVEGTNTGGNKLVTSNRDLSYSDINGNLRSDTSSKDPIYFDAYNSYLLMKKSGDNLNLYINAEIVITS